MPILKFSKPENAYMPFDTAINNILSSNNPTFDNWINCNMVQCGINMVKDSITGVTTPNLYYVDQPGGIIINAFPADFLLKSPNGTNMSSIIDTLLNCDYYVFLYYDRYYISSYLSYKNEHYIHPALVYGSDNNNIFLGDFFEQGCYDLRKCTKDEINNATLFYYTNRFCKNAYESDIVMIKPEKHLFGFEIDKLKCNINAYLNSCTVLGEKKNQCYEAFGISNFSYILEYLNRISSQNSIDYRIFCWHVSHKNLILKKISYLSINNNYFDKLFENAKELLFLSKLLLSLALKYNVTEKKEPSMIKKINDIVKQLSEKEQKFFEVLLNKL